VHEPIGVLLTNAGTPDAPTAAAVRRYLRQFLSDRRVVDLPRALWWPLLHLVILPFRSPRAARAYASVWTAEGSPLLVVSRRQAEALELALRACLAQPVHVALGMGYGSPSLGAGLAELRDRGCWRVLVLPLFPQYASPTVGSAFDGVTGVLRGWRQVPELRFACGYHDHPGYVAALAKSVRELWERDGEPDRLLLSFHGLPARFIALGDPYRGQCEETARLLVAALGLDAGRVTLAFQSRFGREEWLEPYTDEVLRSWGQSGVGTVDVVAPGFAADCLETLEEIAIRYRATFLAAGGGRFRYVPALNERPDHVAALADVVRRRLAGWDAGAAGAA
jgi:protoporphyrin/coproporphyrin ferrochelatase